MQNTGLSVFDLPLASTSHNVHEQDQNLRPKVKLGVNPATMDLQSSYLALYNFNNSEALPHGIAVVNRFAEKDETRVGEVHFMNLTKAYDRSNLDFAEAVHFTITGFSNYSHSLTVPSDGIGSAALSEVAFVDGDELPDLVFGSHWGMANSGALFIYPGKLIDMHQRLGMTEIDVSTEGLLKILGFPASELAPPETIYSEESEVPYCANIFVSADNDERQTLLSGSIYRLNLC